MTRQGLEFAHLEKEKACCLDRGVLKLIGCKIVAEGKTLGGEDAVATLPRMRPRPGPRGEAKSDRVQCSSL